MKRVLSVVILGSLLGMITCDDGGNSTRYCDAAFIDGCENGVYLICERTKADERGRVVAKETFEYLGMSYSCNDKDELVPSGCTCKDGVIVNDHDVELGTSFCGYGDLVYSCSGTEIVANKSYCVDNAIVSCRADGTATKDLCESGFACIEYERGDNVYAGCFKSSEVTDGCEKGTTAYGACSSANVLTFCTHKDPAKGKTIQLDCPQMGSVCVLVENNYGYDCAHSCSTDNMTTDRGYCKDNVLYACAEDDSVYTEDCSKSQKTCQFNAALITPIFDCL